MAAPPFAVRAALAIFVLLPSPATAQYNTGSILGVVRDQQSDVIEGALVVAVNAANGRTVTRATDSSGRFSMPELALGRYTLTVERQGFATFRRDGVVVEIGRPLE